MAEILRGKAVADSLTEINRGKVEELKRAGITPTLGIIRL